MAGTLKNISSSNARYRPLENDRGASVLGVVLILMALTILGVISVSFLTTGLEESTGEVSSARALSMAEAGLETASGRLNRSPGAASNWLWNEGYLNKTFAGGTFDVEVLQYDSYPSQTSVSPYCVAFTSRLINTGANPARTMLVTVTRDPAVNPGDLGIELYDADLIALGACASPGISPVAASITSNNPETIRYRAQDPVSPPTDVTYTVRVLGNSGGTHSLAISHPDQPGFSVTNDTRGLICAGKSGESRRELFTAFRRQPC